jgi:NAD(P)-dependent dehydrogenase (short-subunit alcohol dehydrogenase family)
MLRNTRTKLFAALVAALALSALVFAAGAGAQRTGATRQANQNTRGEQSKRVIVGRSSETRQGSRVTITADDSLKDYSAYRSGDRFYVVLPKSAAGGGAIVNQSSTAAWMNVSAYYGIAKLAINGLTACLAREFAPAGIRVNAIAPGFTNTEATRQLGSVIDTLVAAVPLARIADPDEMATACAFLLSDEASYITGHVLSVDGGQLVRV